MIVPIKTPESEVVEWVLVELQVGACSGNTPISHQRNVFVECQRL